MNERSMNWMTSLMSWGLHTCEVNNEPPGWWNLISISSERLFKSQVMSGILSPKILQWSSTIKLLLTEEYINV